MHRYLDGLSVQTVVERSCEQQWPLGLGKVKGSDLPCEVGRVKQPMVYFLRLCMFSL